MRKIRFFALILSLLCCSHNVFATNYHLVGWVNTFVPGGGEALNGKPFYGLLQATLEVSSFAYGYHLSAKSPLTLDGVPEELPQPSHSVLSRSTKSTCIKFSGGKCVQYRNSTTTVYSGSNTLSDITPALQADWLQEFGIKYHMVNVYNAYRDAASGSDNEIDLTSTKDLFLAPFQTDNLLDPLVLWPLVGTLGIFAAYYATDTPQQTAPLTASSNNQYGLTYIGMYPFGSGAPEEMFYRGFLQNEFLELLGSAWFAVPLSATAYAFSHSSDARIGAGASGLYLGYLTHKEHGRLSKAIAYHFWSDVFFGIYAVASLWRNQNTTNTTPLLSFQTEF